MTQGLIVLTCGQASAARLFNRPDPETATGAHAAAGYTSIVGRITAWNAVARAADVGIPSGARRPNRLQERLWGSKMVHK